VTRHSLPIVFSAGLACLIAGAVHVPHAGAQDQTAPAQSQSAPQVLDDTADDTVVARVDGTPITAGQLKLAQDELGQDLAQLPQEARGQLVMQYVVELNLLADAAREAGLDQTEDYKRLSRYYELRALRDVFFQREVREKLTDEALKQLYDERIGNAEPEPEVKARHILVETEDEAKAIVEKLEGGADFAELAKAESTGPSSANGGDLGFFTKDQMVGPFAEAAFTMQTGEVSAPVKTRFGWHVIKVEDKRDRQPPKFADIKDRLEGALVRQQLQQRMAELRDAAKIEILDESLKPQASGGQQSGDQESQ